MDNAGVPMFFGKNDDDLDPSLRQGYSGQADWNRASSEVRDSSRFGSRRSGPEVTDQSKAATEGSAVNAPSQSPHKIPESELEGTDSWVKDNDQMP